MIDELINIFQENKDWNKLVDISKEYIQNISNRDAQYYYLVGYAYENQKDISNAKIYYFESLGIESTYQYTIYRLSNILINEGNYSLLREILVPYLQSHGTISSDICIYWGLDGFTSARMQCLPFNNNGSYQFSFDSLNQEQIKYFRLDPAGLFNLDSINIILYNGQEGQNFNDFSGWKLSKDVEREGMNSFNVLGMDPYIYTVFDNPISISSINKIEINMSMTSSYNKEINEILQKLNEKEI